MYESIAFLAGCVSGFIALALLGLDFYLLHKVRKIETRLENIRDCLTALREEVRDSKQRRSGLQQQQNPKGTWSSDRDQQTRRIRSVPVAFTIYSQLSPENQTLAEQGVSIQSLLEEEARLRSREIHRVGLLIL